MPDEHDQSDPAARPRRRTFTAEYKLALLAEYDAADAEARGALLRREGLYSSHISEWRKARDRGTLTGPVARRRKSAEQVELEKLRKRNDKLEAELAKTKLALEITGKAHALLELLSESADDDGPPRPRLAPPNALTTVERVHVLSVLHQPEHVDLAVTQVWARLLDVGVYLCSIATMYRILRDAGENRERRRQRTHPAKTKPQLQATCSRDTSTRSWSSSTAGGARHQQRTSMARGRSLSCRPEATTSDHGGPDDPEPGPAP